jgi:hypothetical protein
MLGFAFGSGLRALILVAMIYENKRRGELLSEGQCGRVSLPSAIA